MKTKILFLAFYVKANDIIIAILATCQADAFNNSAILKLYFIMLLMEFLHK